MRHAAFWAINGLLLAAALSVVVSATTVRWLYPSTPRPSTRMKPLPFLKSHDLRAPDWGPLARQSGFTGPIWRLKGNLEEVPVVSGGEWLGAAGLLVDKEGDVVASLTALDSERYGLLNGDSPESVA